MTLGTEEEEIAKTVVHGSEERENGMGEIERGKVNSVRRREDAQGTSHELLFPIQVPGRILKICLSHRK